jgi:hypothetical protein
MYGTFWGDIKLISLQTGEVSPVASYVLYEEEIKLSEIYWRENKIDLLSLFTINKII